MSAERGKSSQHQEPAPQGFDSLGWPLPEVRSMMVDNFVRSWRHHWIACLVLFVLAAGLVAGATLLSSKTWIGRATVYVTPWRPPDMVLAKSGTTDPSVLQMGMIVRNIGELVRDHQLQKEVIEETDLAAHMEKMSKRPAERVKTLLRDVLTLAFIRGKSEVNWNVRAKKALDGRWLNITPSEGTSKIPLFVYGDNPEKTVEVGDAVLRKIQEYMDAAERRDIEGQIATLEDLIGRAETETASTEKSISDYRKELGVFLPQRFAELSQESLNTLEREMNVLTSEREGLEASVAEWYAELEKYEPFTVIQRDAETIRIDDRGSQRIERDLADLRSKRSAMAVSRPESSPEIQALDEQIKTMQEELARARSDESENSGSTKTSIIDWDPRYQNIFDRWLNGRAQLTLVGAKMTGVQNAITRMQENQLKAIEADEALKRMNRQLQLELGNLSDLKDKRRSYETMLAQDHVFQGLQVVQWTSVNTPEQADSPNRILAFILAIAIGIFVALVLPVAYDYLNQTLLTSRQAATIPGLRVAAIVPRMSEAQMTKSVSA